MLLPYNLSIVNISHNMISGEIISNSPILLDVDNNKITGISINDTSKLVPPNCDLSYNPMELSTVSTYESICQLDGLKTITSYFLLTKLYIDCPYYIFVDCAVANRVYSIQFVTRKVQKIFSHNRPKNQ